MAHGTPNLHEQTDKERFFTRVIKDANGCWLWTGDTMKIGYGRFHDKGKRHLAHRWSYECFIGPIPEGLELDHLCRVRNCVNPKHLEPVTSKENVLRGFGPSAINASKTKCPLGHTLDDSNTYIEIVHDGRKKRHCKICRRENTRSCKARKSA